MIDLYFDLKEMKASKKDKKELDESLKSVHERNESLDL